LKIALQLLLVFIFSISLNGAHAQKKKRNISNTTSKEKKHQKPLIKYGMASYYAIKFHGRKTASGETYNSENYTAACNIFPLHTWIKVTNLKNDKTIIVRINDRLHSRNKRVIDISESGAKILGYTSQGITKVKIEALYDFNPETSEL
jgi:rare lipoprotein A